jgi:hypothetical protein
MISKFYRIISQPRLVIRKLSQPRLIIKIFVNLAIIKKYNIETFAIRANYLYNFFDYILL